MTDLRSDEELLHLFERSLRQPVSSDPRTMDPGTVYHYTGAHGAIGILESKELWLTNYSFLNDPLEVQYGQKLILDTLRTRRGTTATKNAPLLNKLEASFEEQVNSEVYVGCFSRCRDDLSQWRAYGSAASGRFCIGFDLDSLYACSKKAPEIGIYEVIYDRAHQADVVADVIDRFLAFANKHALHGEASAAVTDRAGQLLARLAPRLKSAAYAAEEEWRVVSFVPASNVERLRFRVAGGVMRPYISFSLCHKQRLPIVEVIVLAPSRQAPSRKAVDLLLHKSGVRDVKAEISGVPFVDWSWPPSQ